MKIIRYTLIAAMMLATTGCYKLDLDPPDSLSGNTFWKNEEHVKKGLMGVYSAVKNNYAFGLDFMFDYLGETAYGYDTPFPAIMLGSYTTTDGTVSAFWQSLYEGVQRANSVIANVSKMETISADVKEKAIAEARFLRALCYFRLLDLFGGVPYYDETTDVNSDFATMKNKRSTAGEIRTKIIEDLTMAIDKLQVTWPDSEYGRATKGAAYALRGKVYLYDRKWDNAIADFEEIVYDKSNNYGYRLHSDYAELFKLYNGKKSNEMIFALQSKAGGENYGLLMGSLLGTKAALRNIPSNNCVPSEDLIAMYDYPNGKPFDWEDIFPGFVSGDASVRKNFLAIKLSSDGKKIESFLNADTAKIAMAYRNRDPRLVASVITPYSTYLGTTTSSVPESKLFVLHNTDNNGGTPMESNGFIRNGNAAWTTSFWRKFVPEGNLGGYWHDYTQTPFEFPLIRLGDVLLMLSEAYNESGQLNKAIAEFNKVRSRAQMPGLNSGPDWMNVASREEMQKRIQKERAIELAIEGHRFSDLKRWGIAKEILANRPALSIYGQVQYRHSFADRDLLWPIPAVEIERNPDLVQNPGW
jgi:tetratricopeptide (TPR) repeat protein